jgi:hypothetical protein
MQRILWSWIAVVGTALVLVISSQAVNLNGSLVLVDTTHDTTPVDALSVAIHSPTTFVMYRAQPDHDGQFELKDVRPGHYRLELGVPSRLKTFTIGGKEVSPADFEVSPDTHGPVRIVLSMKVGTLTVKVEGAPNNARLTAVLAPHDEFLTLNSQFTNPVVAGATQLRFLPPGRYLLFVVDTDLSNDIATDARLRDALKEHAAATEVLADENTTATGRYISRQVIDEGKRPAGQPQ